MQYVSKEMNQVEIVVIRPNLHLMFQLLEEREVEDFFWEKMKKD